ncbi:hypothetical protein GCM10010977_02540 [Citricoccus zhacaiensis]|uniref:Uncharacterized protein n=1 Tax=Citricoccus zhacaiensis TaxID=489142 RepID=A0ABQ2LMR3_9MICC|nr:hypothetical protein [Citricoccus zhacaiensis]GGO40360.1 hypothetical protein GCM10010977_02540 [Citricoccus zhacaiensis]
MLDPRTVADELDDVVAVIRRADDVDDLGAAERKLRALADQLRREAAEPPARTAYSQRGLTVI